MRNKWPARFLTLRAPRHNSFPPLMSLSGQSASQETKFAALGHRDMSRWPSAANFVSWLALCPDNDISGGKLLWRGARRVKNRAGHLFRMAAYALHRSPTPLGNYLRRMKAKLGPQAATMATAHKIAVIFYTMIKNQVEYDETIWDARDAQREKRLEAKLKRQAKQLGFELVPVELKAA